MTQALSQIDFVLDQHELLWSEDLRPKEGTPRAKQGKLRAREEPSAILLRRESKNSEGYEKGHFYVCSCWLERRPPRACICGPLSSA